MKKIYIVLAVIIIPVAILLADHYLLQEDVQVGVIYGKGREWDFIAEHKDEIPSSLLQLATRNKETLSFVANYINNFKKERSMNIKEDLKHNRLPLLLQWDERWGYKSYGNDLMAINGCGPTCLSMVLSYLKQEPKYNPYYVAKFALRNGYCTGESTSWSLMNQGAEELGLKVQQLSLSETEIRTQLELGNPIICSMSKGIFTTTGHFIVLREYKDGKIYVNDPNSREKSQRGYTFEEIQYQIKNLWAYSL